MAGLAASSSDSIIFATLSIRFSPSVETTSVLLSSSMPIESLPLNLHLRAARVFALVAAEVGDVDVLGRLPFFFLLLALLCRALSLELKRSRYTSLTVSPTILALEYLSVKTVVMRGHARIDRLGAVIQLDQLFDDL